MTMRLTESFERDFASGDSGRIQDAMEAIYWIADLYMFGGEAEGLHEMTSYRDEIIQTEIDDELIASLKAMLRAFIKTGPSQYRASAIGLLGKFADSDDAELFRKHLEQGLATLLAAHQVLHSSLIALNDLAELGLDGGTSVLEVEKNVELAIKYLKRFGKEFFW